ncbi:Agamous-like MADS-box protein AGL80 [Cardamine amara subsp. amara]|uniref:Agamous-like MADS-box protein AGL80 n=1 Tax=Cardamine amara subsp. amara TaxID=228776 RepID=A0ABD1B188_CARAN
MVHQKSFLQQRISKATESLRKLRRENKELEMKELMFGCMSGKYSVAHINKNALPDLHCAIEQQLKEINRRREILTTNDVPPPSPLAGAGAVWVRVRVRVRVLVLVLVLLQQLISCLCLWLR